MPGEEWHHRLKTSGSREDEPSVWCLHLREALSSAPGDWEENPCVGWQETGYPGP